ncbi:hypothetical protein [Jiangella mangrovi]|uniref:Uncharacterized protein n=1 Tax=Jiangella mangrovi TaxID=1524084 RepID=A0A7W9LM48_9ACTN|nr:hypothetical protein [Jiangella mangrovi]MBB5788789.1 hypothetical protein [Jiangella mangrovi]
MTLESGDQVTVLTFETDRAPYLVKSAKGDPTLEVPYRSGSGTRSARRAELLRMLAPTISLPATTVLSARSSMTLVEWTGREPRIDCSGQVELFVEHLTDRTAMIPNHLMSGILRGREIDLQLHLTASSSAWWGTEPPPPDPRPGVSSTKDGLLITAPGSGSISFRPQDSPDAGGFPEWITEETLDLEIQLAVTGTSRMIHMKTAMRREPTTISTGAAGTETRVSWLMK